MREIMYGIIWQITMTGMRDVIEAVPKWAVRFYNSNDHLENVPPWRKNLRADTAVGVVPVDVGGGTAGNEICARISRRTPAAMFRSVALTAVSGAR
jgi:hypothetical protein